MSEEVKNTAALSQLNQKLVAEGESLPALKLKDGSRVQTGTVATMLHNVALLNDCRYRPHRTYRSSAGPQLHTVWRAARRK
jgi:hypothetical protein